MREIEFRGYDLDTRRWYYGSYVRLERTSPYPMSQTPEKDNKKHQDEQIDHYIFFTEMNDWGLETKKLRATVDPKSVSQYIGIEDKNGRKAYIADLVKIRWNAGLYGSKSWVEGIYQIKQREDFNVGGGFGGFYLENGPSISYLSTGEIVGNYYENPELLDE